jgi:3-methyladenine DNA glycosylase AlkD
MKISKIRKILKERIDKKRRFSFEKFVSSSEKFYGVKVSILNKIAKEVKEADFDLVEKLWKSKIFEERLLAIKILGRI